MNTPIRVCIVTTFLALAACSNAVEDDSKPSKVTTVVSAVMPSQQVFHSTVAAFGRLAADKRRTLSLSLPQGGQVVATDVIDGQRVKQGAVLMKLATDPATRSAYVHAENALTVARADLTRTRRLRDANLATDAQLDAARKTLADAQATVDAQGKLGGAQAITTLTAPADGMIMVLGAQLGQRVAAGTKLLEFAPNSALVAQLAVEPAAAATIQAGMPVSLNPVYAARDTPALQGTVTWTSDAVDTQSHLVNIIAMLSADPRLAAGTALSAKIETAHFTAWAVPRNALLSDEQGSYILQIEHGKAHRVAAKVIMPVGSPVGIEGGIDPRAPVITLGSYELEDGDSVQATPGTTPRTGGAGAQ